MGWISIGRQGAGPAKHLHELAAKVEVENQVAEDRNCHVQAEATVKQDEAYPVLSRRTKDKDLPLIPLSQVVKRNGKDGNRLCTYL